jgi:hypothetical protein
MIRVIDHALYALDRFDGGGSSARKVLVVAVADLDMAFTASAAFRRVRGGYLF